MTGFAGIVMFFGAMLGVIVVLNWEAVRLLRDIRDYTKHVAFNTPERETRD